jgi:hypothetical protein
MYRIVPKKIGWACGLEVVDKFRKKVGRKRMLVADRGIIVGIKAVFVMVTG